LGVCRSLWNWVTFSYQNLIGVGTNLKFYILNGGTYYDITPTQTVHTLTNPFATVNGSTTVTVTDATGGYINNDFVTFTGATAVGGITISGEYQIAYSVGTTYTITAASAATSTTTGGGTVYAVYQINTGPAYAVPLVGWGSGTWGSGTWGNSATSSDAMRIWNQFNFGEDLIYGPRGGPLYYWDATIGYQAATVTMTIANPCVVTSTTVLPDLTAIVFETTGALPTGLLVGTTYYTRFVSSTTFNLSLTPTGALIITTGSQSGTHTVSQRGVLVSQLNGASSVPLTQIAFLVSDASRFVLCFGTNDIGSTSVNPLLIRWSDQESVVEWSPAITNQAGSITLSHGSTIVTAIQSKQEIVVFTDAALYSLQYLGPPYVWGSQLLADNTSIAGPNAVALAAGIIYWMGVDKFYKYDGRLQTLNCDLLRYVYNDIDRSQFEQVYAATNEGFSEVWWFYPSNGSTTNDSYVVFNYIENVWYYGTMARTAWLDSGLQDYPLAATYNNNLVQHELGVDDGTTATLAPINAFITSSQFDIGDGHDFAFVWRMLPDLTFNGSTDGTTPSLTMQLLPLQNSGSGFNNPKSVGGTSSSAEGTVTATQTYPIDLDTYNGQLNIRVRARQMAMKISSNTLGTQWQLGAPRIDIRQDGRRGG
jgi:energy-coupling factor transporter transmembrane protein EcfT